MNSRSYPVLSFLAVLGVLCWASAADLTLNIPNTMAIDSPDFQYVIACYKDGKQEPCQSNAFGLPSWMTLENNVLRVK